MTTDKSEQTYRRRVFYIPGYDPFHPRRYRELYRKESALQAKISGYDIEMKAKTQDGGAYGWRVTAHIEGRDVAASVDVLDWSNIVRTSMSDTIISTYLNLFRTAWTYIGSGTLRRLVRLRKGPVIAALYPVGVLIGQLILAILLAMAITWGLGQAALATLPQGGAMGWISRVLAMVAGGAVGVWLLHWFRAHDGKVFAYYLMQNYTFTSRLKGVIPPEMETQMAQFTDLIAAALTDDVDEVLVVGHSSGAHVGVSVLADLIRAGRVPENGPALGFLSLGQVVPMVSFLPRAHRLRADLQYLCARDELAWVDVSAPGDGCAFALCDPVTVSGVAPENKKWPLVFSAAFTKTLSPERWAELRWRFFQLHFQYMCAFDRPGDYDYFRITAGPQSLRARFAGRSASKTRINVAVSKYTSVAA